VANELLIVLKALDKASGPIKDVDGSLNKLSGTSQSLLSKGLNPLQSMLGVGIKAAAGAGVAALGGLGATIISATKDAASMEQQVADIASVMGVASNEVAPLNQLIKDLGMDPNLKVEANEAADAIEMLARNGLTMDEVLGGAAKSTVLLANATNADFGVAANIATDVMAQFNIEAEDMAKAVNGISSVTTSSKFDINDYGLALAQAGGVAATVGVGFDDFNTTISAISPLFASGSDAGTSFKTFLQRLVPTTNDAEEAMAELGLITAEGGNAFFDAQGNMKSMAEIAGALEKATSGLSDAQMNQYLSTIFGSDAMRAAAGIAGFTEEEFRELQATMGKTDAAEMAATRMDTFAGALEILQGVIGGVSLEIGDIFLPIARQMTELLTEFISSHSEDIIEFFRIFAERLSKLVTYLVSVTSESTKWLNQAVPLFLQMRDAVQGLYGRMISLIDGLWLVIKPVIDIIGHFVKWQDLGVALAALVGVTLVSALGAMYAAISPVVIVIASAVSAVAAMRIAWESDFLGMKTVLQNVWTWIMDTTEILRMTFERFGIEALNEIKTFVTGGDTEFKALHMVIKTTVTTIRYAFEQLIAWLVSQLPAWLSAIQGWADGAWRWLVDTAIPKAIEAVQDWSAALISWIASNLPAWLSALAQWASAAWTWIRDTAVPNALSAMVSWGISLFNFLRDNLPGWVTQLSAWATAAWEWITKTAIPLTVAKISEWVTNLVNTVQNNLPNWIATLARWAEVAWRWIVDVAIPNTIGRIAEWAGDLIQWLVGKLPDFIATMLRWATELIAWIGEALPKAIEAISNFVVRMIEWLTGTGADNLKSGTSSWVDSLLLWISEELMPVIGPGLEKLIPVLKTAVQAIAAALWEAAKAIGKAFIQGMFDVFGANYEAFKQQLDGIKNAIVERVSTWVPQIKEQGKRTLQFMRDGLNAAINDPVGAANSAMDSLINAFNNRVTSSTGLQKHLWTLGRDTLIRMRDGLNHAINDPVGAANSAMNSLINAFNNRITSSSGLQQHLWTLGRDVLIKLKDGMNATINDPLGVAEHIASNLVNVFNHWFSFDHFYSLGTNIMQGLIDGINSMYQAAIDAANAVGTSVMDAWEWIFGISSPSKVFFEYGQFMMEGLRDGMMGMADAVTAPFRSIEMEAAGAAVQTTNNFNQQRTTNNTFMLPPGSAGEQSESELERIRLLNSFYGGGRR